MKIREKVEVERNVRYFCADILPRYYEDAEIDGEEDISYDEQKNGAKPKMPLVVEDENARHLDEKWIWKIKIDLKEGRVVGWPSGTRAVVHYKVCDQGIYWLEDEEGNVFHKIEDYVPSFLDWDGDGYGDYVQMNINADGTIEYWYDEDTLEEKIEAFLESEGF